ncbi:hypothetical protein OG963_14890 [Streptomyces sp. NBC_01707]|uniref:hypothetical protein n=1 Tax=Streptomyces sp. NBC_01707 TaxID=2975914 RepID=UPI00352F6DDF
MTLVTCDPDTGLRRGPVRFPDGNPPPPFGCRKCGMEAARHYADVHRWERPTDAQILARMKARACQGEAHGPDLRHVLRGGRPVRQARAEEVGPMTKDLDTVGEVREFLRLCLNPSPKRAGRTVAQLANVLPDWLAERLTVHAPHVTELREAAVRADAEAARARKAYADALGAWIAEETTR